MNCPKCNLPMQSRGIRNGQHTYYCTGDNYWHKVKEGAEEPSPAEADPMGEKSSYTEGQDFINIVCASKRVLNIDDIVTQFHVDLDKWEIDSFTAKTSEGYRKDRVVQWDVTDGVVKNGHVDDSGKMLIVPLYHMEVKLKRKRTKISEKTIDDLFAHLSTKNLSPVTIDPQQYSKNGKALIVPIADFHLGLFATVETNGNEYNLEIAEQLYLDTLRAIKARVASGDFEEVVFVVGNDFMNSDNLNGTTTKGTPQDNDGFWYEILDKALELLIVGVNSMAEISKVKVFNVISNHDNHSMYSLMKALELYYRDNENVYIDTGKLDRKYYQFGTTLVGLAHDMAVKKALEIMTTEAKDKWSTSHHFYWMLAHLHQAMQYEKQGYVEIYRLPTFSGTSRWSIDNAYLQTEKRSQCFILDRINGIESVMNIVV